MTCKDFEEVIHELAIGREAYARHTDALEHASRCLWCAVRLEEEARLTKDLQGLREALGAYQAPPRVEEALVCTFRGRANGEAAGRAPAGLPARPRLIWAATLGAVATLALLAFALAPFLYRHSNRPSPKADQSGSIQSATPSSAMAVQPLAAGQARPAHKGRTQKVVRETPASEVATEFIPLATCDDPECLDEAVVVRMALSSDALLMLGIPVDGDRASGPVLADIVLGSDGVPYGIRFVD